MRECQVADRKLCITEWSNALSNRNYLNDSCFRAAFIMENDSCHVGEGGYGLFLDGIRLDQYLL